MTQALLLLLLSGTLRGHVTYAGHPVASAPTAVTADKRVCGETQPDPSLVVDSKGGLANAVVFLQEKDTPGPKSDLKLDQQGCRFLPHVQAAQSGSSLTAINSDPALHTVHGTLVGKTAFNQAMPLQGMKKTFPLAEPGLIKVTCDAGHSWMSAYVYVLNHPYFAVTGKDGSFEIQNVPPGEHTLSVWHERLGTASRTVKAGSTVDIQLK